MILIECSSRVRDAGRGGDSPDSGIVEAADVGAEVSDLADGIV